MEKNEIYYYNKYLKYKNKYLLLQEGGLTMKSGIYYLFIHEKDKEKINEFEVLSTFDKKIKSKFGKKNYKSFPSMKNIKQYFPNSHFFYKNKKLDHVFDDKYKDAEYDYFYYISNMKGVKTIFYYFISDNDKKKIKYNFTNLFTESIETNLNNDSKLVLNFLNKSEHIKGIKIYKIKINRLFDNELLETVDFNHTKYKLESESNTKLESESEV